MIAIGGIFIIWDPFKDDQFYGELIDGECYSLNLHWIAVTWVVVDILLSILLLLLFVRPIQVINKTFGDTPRSVATLRSMRQLTKKNRNLLICSTAVTIGIFTAIAILGKLDVRTALYLFSVDRLVTLQCITMTFTYDGYDYFYCRACFNLCFQDGSREIEEIEQCYHAMDPRNSKSESIIVLTSSTGYENDEK